MRITLLVLTLLSVFGIFLMPSPAFAAIAHPDELTIERLEAYENVIEDSDQLYIFSFNVEYATSPTGYTATELFLVRLMDGTTELGVTSPYSYYNDGYSYGVVGLYFSAADVTAKSMTFGAGSGYSVQLCGNPLLDWAGGTAPQTATGTWELWLSSDNPTTYVTNRMRVIAQKVEDEWVGAINLIEGMAGEKTLTSYGEDYFTNSIPNLILIAPDVFAASRRMPDISSREYNSDYFIAGNDNAGLSIHSGTYAAQTFTVSATYTIDRAELHITRVGTPTNDLRVYICSNSGTSPNVASILCSGTISVADVSTYTDGEWNEVSFGDEYELTASGTYSIVALTVGGNFNNRYVWRMRNANEYDGGHAASSINSGLTWTSSTGDLLFITKAEGNYSKSFDYKLIHQLDGTAFDTSGLAASIGISREWLNGIVWFAVTILFAIGFTQVAQSPKAIIWVMLFMMPVGAAFGFVHIYLAAFIMFVAFLIAIYSVAWEKSG